MTCKKARLIGLWKGYLELNGGVLSIILMKKKKRALITKSWHKLTIKQLVSLDFAVAC